MEKKVLSCEFNMDTGCVEVKYADGGMISINCTKVENEVARNMYAPSELDWLIYNAPMDYVNLLLHGDIRENAYRFYSARTVLDQKMVRRTDSVCHSEGAQRPWESSAVTFRLRKYWCRAQFLLLLYCGVVPGDSHGALHPRNDRPERLCLFPFC